MVEEIISHSLDNERGKIYVEFILVNEEVRTFKELDIYIEDLEEYCDLFDNLDWVNYDDEYDEQVTIQQSVDLLALHEGLTLYLEDNIDLL
jgi:hypothetical protein|tara:strand:+ start:977 stop:1249 length:273 start_codon:yes stop_codon:yes gene_type:complete